MNYFRNIALLLMFGTFLFNGNLVAQDPISDEQTFESRYARNIKKSRINSVYIPKDLDEAMEELKALSSEGALAKFKSGEEGLVAKRLHFGLGRWMIYNWNFYEGSRFSHYLKEMGVAHPDDQARLVIIALHRQLNEKDLALEDLIVQLNEARKKLLESLNEPVLIKQEKRIKQKN